MAPKKSEKKVDCSLKYIEDFNNWIVVLGKIIRYPFFKKYKFGVKNWFEKQSLIKFVQINEVGYPRTEASTSVEIIALVEEMRIDIQTLKANQPIAASQPLPQTLASSSTTISPTLMEYLKEMRNDIQTLRQISLLLKLVRVDVVQQELQARDNGAVKMMEELEEEIKSCSQSQQEMTIKLENLIKSIKWGVEMIRPA
ncbi:hypothetical protein QYF36_001196 [Acer negundo]|nr:hypothetical protein QYF36_001196 [Acer negundo]